MAVQVTVPQSGESISEVQVGAWRKSEGDHVDLDEILVQLETDKAAMDLPSPVSGVLTKILKQQGEEAAVGDVIALIQEGGSKPTVRKAEDRRTRANRAPAQPPGAAGQSRSAETRIMPAARRLLEERGLSGEDVEGTGPGGRILKEDVQRLGGTAKKEAATIAESAGGPEILPADGREEEIRPMSPLRRVIAKHLVEAQHNAALLTTFNEADMSAVMALRTRYQETFQARYGVKLGFMSFFVKASIEALKLVPQVNAELRDHEIVFKNYYDIGVAIGGGRGLVVPVLRNAERLSFAEVERAIGDFAKRARSGQLELSELKGGTFTISNGGIYGSMLSTPIVNAPQSGILGLHAIQERPVAIQGQVVVRPMMYLALTYDHRLVDGREAVTFLKQIKDLIEDPVRILVEI